MILVIFVKLEYVCKAVLWQKIVYVVKGYFYTVVLPFFCLHMIVQFLQSEVFC